MENVVKKLTQISRWLSWAGGALFLASAVLISLDVVFRALFRSTLFESFELSSYAFAIATSLGLAYTLATKGHIRIEVIYNLFGLRTRAVLDVVALASLSIVATVLVYWCSQTVLQNAAMGARSNSSLAMPLVAPQSVWLLGMIWFAIVCFVLAAAGLVWLLRRKFVEVHQALGVGSLQEEISANVDISAIQLPKAG
jgi:TRAP-type C4-dicarboxylate transport system permease small subunit